MNHERPPGIPAHWVKTADGWSHPSRLLAGSRASDCEQNPVPALVQKAKRKYRRKNGVVVIVTLIRAGSKTLDEDNLIFACKSLRDSIATSLGVDDADRRILWQYRQYETKGKPGLLVMIELREYQ